MSADGGPALNLPAGFRVEPARYSVTVTVLDRHGRPDIGGLVSLVNGDLGNAGSANELLVDPNGRATARLAPGFYGAESRIETYAADGSVESVTYGGIPEVTIVPGADLLPGGAISLHGTATDADGNSIDQTVTDLIRVR